MREDWKYERLGNIATYINGFAFKPEDWTNEGLPIIRIQNLTEQSKTINYCNRIDIPQKYLVKNGDVLISWSATLGVFEWKKGDALLNQHIFKVVFDKININKQYFIYAIYMSIDEMSKHTNGATMRHIRKGDFDNIQIPLPSLSEQQRIVDFLDAEFEKIDQLKANADVQLQAAKDLFTCILEKFFTNDTECSEKAIGDCFNSINNGANIKQTKGASGIPITRIETLSNGVFNSNRLGFANIDDASKYEKYLLKDGDLLMSHINSVEFTGRTVAYHNQLPVVIHGMNLLRLVPNDIIDSDFFVYLTKTKKFKDNIRSITHKSVNQASFNTTALKAINIKLPERERQKQIAQQLDAISEKVQLLQQNYDKTITLCNDLKQALLKSIFA